MTRRARLQSAVAFLWILPVAFFAYFSILRPWPVAQQALADLGPGPRIVVSMSFNGSVDGPTRRSQTFLVVPASLFSLAVYEVIQDGGRIRVEPRHYGLLVCVGFYGAWIAASIWHICRFTRRQLR